MRCPPPYLWLHINEYQRDKSPWTASLVAIFASYRLIALYLVPSYIPTPLACSFLHLNSLSQTQLSALSRASLFSTSRSLQTSLIISMLFPCFLPSLFSQPYHRVPSLFPVCGILRFIPGKLGRYRLLRVLWNFIFRLPISRRSAPPWYYPSYSSPWRYFPDFACKSVVVHDI